MSKIATFTDDVDGTDAAVPDDGQIPSGWASVTISIQVIFNRNGAMETVSDENFLYHASTLDNVHDVVVTKGTDYLARLDAAIVAAGGHVPTP